MRRISPLACNPRRLFSISASFFCTLVLVTASLGRCIGEGSRHLSPNDLNEKLLSSGPPQWKMRPKPVKPRDRKRPSKVRRWSKAADSQQRQRVSAKATIANVLATLCPHGMLPIAFGMAAAGGQGHVLPCAMLVAFGILAWYSLISFARAAEVVLVRQPTTDQSTLAAVWSRTIPNGLATTFIPDIACLCLTAGSLLVTSAFLGDLFVSLSARVSFLPSLLRKRWAFLLTLHGIAVLPLCLHGHSSNFNFVTLPGVVGVLYTVVFVVKRFLDKSYHQGGEFFDVSSLGPLLSNPESVLEQSGESVMSFAASLPRFRSGHGLLVLMNICCLAYGCHFNGVKYYLDLKHRTVPALQSIMAFGIGGSALVFLAVMLISHLTFGASTSILFLDNYHPSDDSWAAVARLMTGVALISSYALVFDGMKSALYSLCKLGQKDARKGETRRKQVSAGFLLLITVTACFVTEQRIGTVIGVVGSVFGSIVMYIFPALVNSSLLKMRDRKGKVLVAPFFPGESLFNQGLFSFGVVFAALGSKLFMRPEEVI